MDCVALLFPGPVTVPYFTLILADEFTALYIMLYIFYRPCTISHPHRPATKETVVPARILKLRTRRKTGVGGWGDGTSRKDLSPYECSETPCPLDETSRKHNVPALIHPCHFAPAKTYCIMHNDRDASIQGRCVTIDD